MCDKCGTIFSERAEGWGTYSGAIRRKDPATGRMISVTDDLDSCVVCTEIMNTTRDPMALPTREAITVSPRYEPDPS